MQVSVGTSDVRRDFRRAQLNKQSAPLMPGLPAWVKSVSELPTNVGTSDGRDFRRSGLLMIVGTSDGHRQQVSRTIHAGTPGLGRDFRLSGVPTHVGTSDVHSHHAGYDWESAVLARVVTFDCWEVPAYVGTSDTDSHRKIFFVLVKC